MVPKPIATSKRAFPAAPANGSVPGGFLEKQTPEPLRQKPTGNGSDGKQAPAARPSPDRLRKERTKRDTR